MNFNLSSSTAIAPNQIHKLFKLVLKSGIKLIRRCGFTCKGQPWVSYISEIGASCSHFLKRSLFAGYDFADHGSRVVVTDKSSGATATVSLNILHCSCVAFNSDRFRKPCQHIKAVAEQYPQLEQLIADEELGTYIEQQAEEVAPEFKVGDRVLVNSWRKKVMRKLGEVKRVEDSGAVVFVEGQTLRLFYDELTRQIEEKTPASISGYNFRARSLKQNAENWQLTQAMRQQLTPDEARLSVFGY